MSEPEIEIQSRSAACFNLPKGSLENGAPFRRDFRIRMILMSCDCVGFHGRSRIPTGFRSKAQGRQIPPTLGMSMARVHQPRWGCVSIPKISFVPSNLMFAQKCAQFVLETHLSVVFFVAGNVFFDLLQIRLADREISVASLPFKVGKFHCLLFQPPVGYPFELLNPFCLGCSATKTSQQVDVIVDSANKNRRAIYSFRNLAKIRVQRFSNPFVSKKWAPLFGGKDEMKINNRQRLWHKHPLKYGRNPVRVFGSVVSLPRVARPSQPRALRQNPYGISFNRNGIANGVNGLPGYSRFSLRMMNGRRVITSPEGTIESIPFVMPIGYCDVAS